MAIFDKVTDKVNDKDATNSRGYRMGATSVMVVPAPGLDWICTVPRS